MNENNLYKQNVKNIILLSKNVEGDIIELGVYKGKNTFIIGEALKQIKSKKKYYGLDTFSGYTEKDIELSLTKKQKEGLIANQKSNRWTVDESIIIRKLKEDSLDKYCFLIKGDICETIHNINVNKVSVLYIDVNAYRPAITALNALSDKFEHSALIIIDEHNIGGETAALREFIKKNNGSIYKLNTTHKTGPRIIFHINKNNTKDKTFIEIENALKSNFEIQTKLESEKLSCYLHKQNSNSIRGWALRLLSFIIRKLRRARAT